MHIFPSLQMSVHRLNIRTPIRRNLPRIRPHEFSMLVTFTSIVPRFNCL